MISNHLPAWAVKELREAADTPIPHGEPLARVLAIERAIQKVQRALPQFFHFEAIAKARS